jgi:hypothetical protein
MKKLLFIGVVTLCVSCGGDSSNETIVPPENQEGVVLLKTRVEGEAIADEVNAGLYMVNYLNGEQDELLATAYYVNNQLLTFSENMWNTVTPIYWCDVTTPADFYAYAPYQSDVADARALLFSVQEDQTTVESVAQSDFLWGTLQGQSPTETSFDLTLSHLMSQLTVIVTTSDDLAGSMKVEDVTVSIGGTKTGAKIDLATGAIVPDGDVETVACYSNGDLSYTAILVPQQVPFSNLIQIVWNGNPYTVQNAFNLEAKKKYTLTVKLKKTESGFDIGIDGWDIIGEDFGGTVGG